MISRYGWWGALVALALAGCGADDGARGDEAPAPPAEGARARIVFLGTSLTAGLGLDPEQAYPAAIQRKIDSAGLSAWLDWISPKGLWMGLSCSLTSLLGVKTCFTVEQAQRAQQLAMTAIAVLTSAGILDCAFPIRFIRFRSIS